MKEKKRGLPLRIVMAKLRAWPRLLNALSSRWIWLALPVFGAITSNMAAYRLYDLSYQGGLDDQMVWGMPAVTWIDNIFHCFPYILMSISWIFLRGKLAILVFLLSNALCIFFVLNDMNISDSKNGSDSLLGSWVLQTLVSVISFFLVIIFSAKQYGQK